MNETSSQDSQCNFIRELVELLEFYSARLAAGGKEMPKSELVVKPIVVYQVDDLIREHGTDRISPSPYWFWPVRDNPEALFKALARCNCQLSDGAKKIVDYWCGESKREAETEARRAAINFVEALESRCFEKVLREFTDDPAIFEEASSILMRTRKTVWLDPAWVPDFGRHDATRLGGIPNLSSHTDWPYDRDGRRAFFIGQLNCRDLGAVMPGVLPPEGLLLLFMDQDFENMCNEGPHPCYVIHRVDVGGIGIQSLPEDYPVTGTWVCNVDDLEPELGPTFDVYRPKAWPRTDLIPHTAVRFHPGDYSDLTNEIENRYVDQKMLQIRGLGSDRELKQRVLPKTIARCGSNLDVSAAHGESGFPWTHFHVARMLRHILHNVRDKFRNLKGTIAELYVEFGLGERYGAYRTSKGEYYGIRLAPEHLVDASNLRELLESVRRRVEPKVWDALLLWLDLDEFYKEAKARLDRITDKPYVQPTEAEKADFIDWLAGWVNYGAGQIQEGRDALVASGYPVRDSRWRSLGNDSGSRDCHWFFAETLPRECETALANATILCASHSPDASALLPQEALEAVVKQFGENRPVHSCLGYGICVQHAADEHKDKVLLLEVRTDRAMLTNFGDGALQVWIDRHDMAAFRFDRAFVTTEST